MEETMLNQYKKCSEENDLKLRNVRNIKELVGINISHVPASVRHTTDGYDFKLDPIQNNQRLPAMAERSFLVSQALLQNSVFKSKTKS
jgi:hypothetical protein